MLDLLFTDHAAWFGVPAVLGTVFFALRMAMMLIGGDFTHGGLDAHGVDVHHGDSSDAFKLLSVQGVGAFLMGFGWGGLAARHGADWSWTASSLFAFGTGIGMVWLLALLLRAMISLQSSGNVSLDDAIGAEAEVYVSVPASGQGGGQVKVVINNRQRIANAVTEGGALTPHTRVRITNVNKDNTVTVTAA